MQQVQIEALRHQAEPGSAAVTFRYYAECVNTYGGPGITVPLGGVRQSGNGHDKSMHALNQYLNLKTAWMQL